MCIQSLVQQTHVSSHKKLEPGPTLCQNAKELEVDGICELLQDREKSKSVMAYTTTHEALFQTLLHACFKKLLLRTDLMRWYTTE